MKGGDGEVRRLVRTIHEYDQFRVLLNFVLETGMVYDGWAEEVLCTLPKVVGSARLDDIRPIGLLATLRNALVGIQMRIMRQVHHDHQAISQRQFGGLMKQGTEGVRLIQNSAYENAYI